MSAGVSVAATGSALSFLLFENSNSRNNQAGFLLGDIVSEKKNLISDSDYGEEKTETVIHVHSVIPSESLSSIYSLRNSECVENIVLGKTRRFIVGWYSFRRNVTAIPTLRDRLLHTQLLQLLDANPENFLFCLLSSSENVDNCSHSFRQHFLLFNPVMRKYEAVPLLIENLANISSQYRVPLPPTGERLFQCLIDPSWSVENLVDNLQMKLAMELEGAVTALITSETKVKEAENILKCLERERDGLLKEHGVRASKTARNEEIHVPKEKETENRGLKGTGDGMCGDDRPNSVELVCISDDENSTSPVLGSSNKRSNRNRFE